MALDFTQMNLPQMGGAPTDPIKIFETLPRVPGAPNDLWRGQAQALEEWNRDRHVNDALISLNTGAGKTVVGLLVAKSLVNEGIRNVVYVCPTIDLVEQTAREADNLGIQYTLRTAGGFSNDLFESEKSFCITTYAALFNGLSAIRRRHFPGAIIFDDAHVAEVSLRDAFTLTVRRESHAGLFNQLVAIFRPHFEAVDRVREFEQTVSEGASTSGAMLAPPYMVRRAASQIDQAMADFGADHDDQLKFDYPNLRDKFDRCAVIFGKGVCEISPPFLPSKAIDIFERDVRRIYLSATLTNKVDVIRAFGRRPAKVIEPKNDAGNGERLILFGRSLDEKDIQLDLVQRLRERAKVLVAVPNYRTAEHWQEIATPPSREDFSTTLDSFRRASRGTFILVSRVDGIDLPHGTCRLMVMDGLPLSNSLLERFIWESLHMEGFLMNKLSGRVVQLFGRINRGRSDYGAFLIAGKDLNTWLQRDRFVAMLPPLLQSQILLGRQVQTEMGVVNNGKVEEIIDQVINSDPRDENWTSFYSRYIQAQELEREQAERVEQSVEGLEEAALAEAEFASLIWQGAIDEARNVLDSCIENTARVDEKLAGWQALWLAWCFEHQGDFEAAAINYDRAKFRLGLAIPRYPYDRGEQSAFNDDAPQFVKSLSQYVMIESSNSYGKEWSRLERSLRMMNGTPRQSEESVRALGEFLGFEAVRPDNEHGTGPDVLWIEEQSMTALAFELKTDKGEGVELFKKEIAQGHDHLQFIQDQFPQHDTFGLVYVGPSDVVSDQANPSEQMFHCNISALIELRDEVLSATKAIRAALPIERRSRVQSIYDGGRYKLESIANRLCSALEVK